jgi:hypothetical protein
MPLRETSPPNSRSAGSLLDPGEPPKAAIAEAGKVFDWLADEPDLYSDADLVEHAG